MQCSLQVFIKTGFFYNHLNLKLILKLNQNLEKRIKCLISITKDYKFKARLLIISSKKIPFIDM